MAIDEDNCTGCGLCVNTCPGKNGEKALSLGNAEERKSRIAEHLFNEHENITPFNKFTVKGLGFEKPYFE